MKYSVPQHIGKNQIFLVNFSELEGRWDPIYYNQHFDFTNFKKLSTIANVLGGKRIPLGKNYSPTPTAYLYLRVADIKENGLIDFNELKFIDEDTYKELKRYEIFNGDLAISIAGTIGKVVVIKGIPDNMHVILTENCAKIVVHREDILIEFLQLVLMLPIVQKQIEFGYIQTTIPKLSLDRISNLLLPTIPPLSIQQQIIDKYNAAVKSYRIRLAFAKQKLASIDDYLLGELGITLPKNDFQKLNDRMFEVSFKDVLGNRYDPFYYQQKYTNFINSIANSKYTTIELKKGISFLESGGRPSGGADRYNQEVFSIGGEHVNDCFEVGNGTPKYIPLSYHFFMKKTETKINDIILVKDGATTGKVGIIENHNFVGQNINEHVFLMRCDKTVMLNHYLVYYLHSVIGQNLIAQKITGATIMGITKPSLNSILIPIPPLDKQKEIVAHISAIRAEAKALEIQAEEVLTKAREEVEKMILQSE